MLMSAAVDEATTDDVATDVAPNAASVATVTHDGVTSEFTSVDEAIAALQGGDTLKLLSTESVKSNTVISANDVTIDLDGNELKIVLNDAASNAAIGLDFTGKNVRLMNGSLVDERANDARVSGYIAVRVSGSDASLTVDHVEMKSYQPNSLLFFRQRTPTSGVCVAHGKWCGEC